MNVPQRLATLALAGVAGCYSSSRGHRLEERMDQLATSHEKVAAQLKDTQEKLAATLPRIDAKMAELAKALDTLDRASRRSDADVGVQLQKTIEDLASLRGQMETYNFKIQEMEAVLKKYGEDTESALHGSDALKATQAKRRADELQKPTDKRSFLALADQKLKDGDLPLARALYNEFLRKWGKDELASGAYYGLGETYYQEDKCREALPEYGKVVKDFPKSKVAPNTYLHSAECFKKLKLPSEAKVALEEVIRNFPGTQAAREAKGKLAQLNRSKRTNSSRKGKP